MQADLPVRCTQTGGQEPDLRRERWVSGHMTAKPISIKDAKRKSGGCAPKAVELTLGDLSWVTES